MAFKDGTVSLDITGKTFTMGGDEAEDYIIKGDTILTSYQGNLPYTRFIVQKIDGHYLN